MTVAPYRRRRFGGFMDYFWNRQITPTFSRAVDRREQRTRRAQRKRGSLRSKVNAIINKRAETKYINTATNITSPVVGTSIVVPISLSVQGLTNTTRDGDEILIKSLQGRGTVTTNTNSNLHNDTQIRIILFWAKTNISVLGTGVLPLTTDILMSDSIDSLKQINNRDDFKVLYNKSQIIPILWHITAVTSTHEITFDYYKKFKKPLKCVYDGNAGTIADCEEGHLFALLMTDKAINYQPTWVINWRLNFVDN